MKRRYTILFFVALSPLIGWSWLAAQWNTSMWNMANGIGIFGMLAAAVVAGYALVAKRNEKGWAVITAVASLPYAAQMLSLVGNVSFFMDMLGDTAGVAILLISFGTIATLVTAIVVAVLPPPRPPQDPQVAPARVVD